jgi:hypothetical protein
MCSVVNRYKEPYDVYIGRGSLLGNPFKIDEAIGNTRDVVIAKYKTYLWQQIKTGRVSTKYLCSLNGKKLGCYCKPLACHGDVAISLY